MKSGKVAKMLGIDRRTITNWTDREEFSRFFSPEGRNLTTGFQRTYTESDVLVLNTIRIERDRGATWDDIEHMLHNGERHLDLPPSALTVETTAPVAQYGKIQAYEARIEILESRVDEMQQILTEKDEMIGDLREEIGMLKAMLRMEKEKSKPSGSDDSL